METKTSQICYTIGLRTLKLLGGTFITQYLWRKKDAGSTTVTINADSTVCFFTNVSNEINSLLNAGVFVIFSKCLLQDTGPAALKLIPVPNINVRPALSKRQGGYLLYNDARLLIFLTVTVLDQQA